MSGSVFGKIFKITTWGESHGKATGVVIDGCPAGLPLCEADIEAALSRRKPSASFSSQRRESDRPEILSGVFRGLTTGTPISVIIYNDNARSGDYAALENVYRPGHADYSYDKKYGLRDYRGGGRASGRETAARVAAGAVAKKLLAQLGVSVLAYTSEVCGIAAETLDYDEINNNPLFMPHRSAALKAMSVIEKISSEGDSAGGVVTCEVKGLPPGIGEPVFRKLDACLSAAVMSIGAVKAVEFGNGTASARLLGSENNDAFYSENGRIMKQTNHSGGISGGISDGAALLLRAYIKPTPSISKAQQTVSSSGENISVSVNGRHDAVIVPRAVSVIEAMTAITLCDLMLENMSSDIEKIKNFYGGTDK